MKIPIHIHNVRGRLMFLRVVCLHDDVPGISACVDGDSLLKECEGVL